MINAQVADAPRTVPLAAKYKHLQTAIRRQTDVWKDSHRPDVHMRSLRKRDGAGRQKRSRSDNQEPGRLQIHAVFRQWRSVQLGAECESRCALASYRTQELHPHRGLRQTSLAQ